MHGLPWFPFYTENWFTSLHVRMMGPVARAFYLELLRTQWQEGSIPADYESICRILLMPRDPGTSEPDYDRIVKQVLECFVSNGQGRLINPKLFKVRQEQEQLLNSRRRGALATNEKRSASRSANGERTVSERSASRSPGGDIDIKEKTNTNTEVEPVNPVDYLNIDRKIRKLADRKSL